MLFLIRETLLINWGRGNISVLKDNNSASEKNVDKTFCRDFVNCEYCKTGSYAHMRDKLE